MNTPFKKGVDYDYQAYIGPSADSSTPHAQLEFQIKNRILMKYSDEILFDFGFDDMLGVMVLPTRSGTGYGIMKFVSYPLPEPSFLLNLTLILGGAAYLLNHRRLKQSKQV